MKNLEIFELQAAIDWVLMEQSQLIKEQAFVDERLRHLDKRRKQLEQEKRILEIMEAENEYNEKGYK